MAYIEEEITDLSCSLDTLWDRFCKLERAVEDLTERVSETHDEPQVQQTMDEFVRVVRCKDCKWYVDDIEVYDTCKNEDGIFRPSGDDYCSKGERKC